MILLNNDFIDGPSKIISSTANRINNGKVPTSIFAMEELDKMKKNFLSHEKYTWIQYYCFDTTVARLDCCAT